MKDIACVTGASGGVGHALLAQLVDRYHVKALFRTRTAGSDAWTARGCVPVWGDLSEDAALAELVHGSRFVFHCGALTAGPYRVLHAVNVDGTRRLARLAAAHHCERMVHVSSAAVYGGVGVQPAYVEDLALTAHDGMAVYSLTKLQSEVALHEVCRETGLVATVVRPTCVYGPHTKSYTLTALELLRKGFPVVIGDGRGLMDVVYVDDLATALVRAAECASAAGEVFNIGHETVAWEDFYRYYSRMLNRPVRRVPEWILSGLAGLIRIVSTTDRGRAGEIRRGIEFVLAAARNKSCYPSDKAKRILGYRPRVGLDLGMLRTELWAKRRRLVGETTYSLDFYGALPFRPMALVHPNTEEELRQVVDTARTAGVAVRAIGTLHSQAPIPDTAGICVVLDRYNRVVKVDGDLVTVEAGMQLRALYRALAAMNLALPVSGAIAEQTVAGAISTATHGGSIHRGALSDCVEAVRMIRADGSVIECDRTQEPFHALVVSLGLLGVLSTVTFRCVPAFWLQSRTSVRPAEEVIQHFDDINQKSLFVDMLFYPIADQVEILTVQPAEGPSGEASSASAPVAKRPSSPSAIRTAVVQPLLLTGLTGLAVALQRSTFLQRLFTRRLVGSYYRPRRGPSYEVLAFDDREAAVRAPRRIRDMELAVAYDDAAVALRAVRDHFRKTKRYPLLPVHIRCSRRSESWLSPAYRRDVCWIELWQFPPTDDFTDQIEALLEPWRYRFHWGKASRSSPDYIARQYDRWSDFLALRREWDPHGMFANDYLERYFGRAHGTVGGAPGDSPTVSRLPRHGDQILADSDHEHQVE